MPNPENLKPFKKGDPRINRKGRPRVPDLSEHLAAVLDGEPGAKAGLQKVLEALYKKACKGDVRAARELLNRAYGQAKQSHEVEGGNPIQVFLTEEEMNF